MSNTIEPIVKNTTTLKFPIPLPPYGGIFYFAYHLCGLAFGTSLERFFEL